MKVDVYERLKELENANVLGIIFVDQIDGIHINIQLNLAIVVSVLSPNIFTIQNVIYSIM